MMTVTPTGPPLADLLAQLTERAADAWLISAGDYDKTLRDNVPIRSGLLYDSVHLEQVDHFHFVEHVDAPYADYVNSGTRRMAARHFVETTDADVTPRALGYLAVAGEGIAGWQG